MTNLVEVTVRATDDTTAGFTAIKAKAAKAGDEAAKAFNTAFKLRADASGSEGSGAAGGAASIAGDDKQLLSKLRTYSNYPGGIGILGTGTDTSLISMLRRQIQAAGESGGMGLLGGQTAGGQSIQDTIVQKMTGNSPGNVSTTDMIKQVIEGNTPGNYNTKDFIDQVLKGNTPGNVNTEDIIRQVVEGKAPGNISTTDTIHEHVDDSTIKTQGGKDGRTYGDSFAGAMTSELARSFEDIEPDPNGHSFLGQTTKNSIEDDVSSAVADGVSSGGSKGGSELPGILGSAADNPALAAGIVAAIGTALPFIGQILAEGIVGGFGAGIAAIAIYGASKTKEIQDQFADLKNAASKDLEDIGTSFVPVMNGLLYTAQGTMNTLTPVFANAAKTISGALGSFGSALISAFAQPAVQQSIQAVATAFSGILRAVTPQLAQDVGKIAAQITNIADAVAANPRALADFVGFLTDIAEVALEAVAGLTKVANWIENNWNAIGPLLVGPFLAMTKPIEAAMGGVQTFLSNVWGAIKGQAQTFWSGLNDEVHNGVSQEENDIRGVWDAILSFFRTTWDSISSVAVSAQAKVGSVISSGMNAVKSAFESAWNAIVSFFEGMPARLVGALKALGGDLSGVGKAALGDFLSGLESAAGGILSWLGNFVSSVISKIKSLLGVHSPSSVFFEIGKNLMLGLKNGIEAHAQAAASAAQSAAQKAQEAADPSAPGFSGNPPSGGSVQALMQQMAAARGWTGSQWADLYAVEMRKAGFSLTARNPSSGAYGLAQFINGPGEYAQYGGNATTAAGQITGMLNYIAQRYGSPAGAEAHEQAFGWYGAGGATKAGWAMAGEHGRELIRLPGGSSVIPHGQTEQMVAQGMGGAVGTLHLDISGAPTGLESIFISWLKEYVRISGGGNVQNALGRN